MKGLFRVITDNLNPDINLCDSCKRQPEIPKCLPDDYYGITFGSDIEGAKPNNDNVVECINYEP